MASGRIWMLLTLECYLPGGGRQTKQPGWLSFLGPRSLQKQLRRG